MQSSLINLVVIIIIYPKLNCNKQYDYGKKLQSQILSLTTINIFWGLSKQLKKYKTILEKALSVLI